MNLLRELWQERSAAAETGGSSMETNSWRLFITIEELSGQEPELERYVQDVKDAVERYYKLVKANLKKQQTEKIAATEISDTAQKFAHESLMDALNILSRQCNTYDLDNSWREQIGLNREKIAGWAYTVGEQLEGPASVN